jgi:ABC-type sugar transport system substrate-binding protein
MAAIQTGSRSSMLAFSPSSKQRLRLFVGVAAGSVVLTMAGCGSSSDGSADGDGDLTKAQQECVDKAEAYFNERGLLPESLPPELTPLSEPPPDGLKITRLTPSGVPIAAQLGEEIVKVAESIGGTGSSVVYDGSEEDANRKLLEAIDNSDIVMIDAVQAAAVQTPIAAAKKNGVLLVLNAITDDPVSVPGFGAAPLGGDFSPKLGELAAYAFMRATNCQGKAAAFGLPVDAQKIQVEGIQDVLAEECEDCSLSYTEIPISDIGSPAATNAVVSKLQSDPSINFAYFALGDLAVGLEPALQQAGLEVGVGGALASPPNLAQLEAGKDAFWLGLPPPMTAHIYVDTALRALESGQPTVGSVYPVPVYTADNLEMTDSLPPVYPEDYEQQFRELWQLN